MSAERKKNEALREALLKGESDGKGAVLTTAFDMAVSGRCPSMTIFYLKCRLGWKDQNAVTIRTGSSEEDGDKNKGDNNPALIIDLSGKYSKATDGKDNNE